MRQFFMVMLVAVAAGVMPAMVRADNPNQEAANKIRISCTTAVNWLLTRSPSAI